MGALDLFVPPLDIHREIGYDYDVVETRRNARIVAGIGKSEPT